MLNSLPSGSLPGTTSNSTTEIGHSSQLLILLGLGTAAVALHVALRFPLHLPGRHGLEWLALLLLARQFSPLPWAASLTGSGAAALSVLFNPASAPAYLITGVLLDLGWRRLYRWRHHALLLALLAGAAFAVKTCAATGIGSVSRVTAGLPAADPFRVRCLGRSGRRRIVAGTEPVAAALTRNTRCQCGSSVTARSPPTVLRSRLCQRAGRLKH